MQRLCRKQWMHSLCGQHIRRNCRWRHLQNQKLQCWLCRRPPSCQLLFRHFICAFSQWSIPDCLVLGPHATSANGFPLVHRGHLASGWERCRHHNDFKAFLTQVRFSHTGVPWLDVKDAENPASHAYSLLPISHRKLLLRDVSANLPIQTDTSCGQLWISFPRSFIAVGVFQIPFIFLFACCTGSAFAIVAFLVEIVFAIIAAASVNAFGPSFVPVPETFGRTAPASKEFSCWSWTVNQHEPTPGILRSFSRFHLRAEHVLRLPQYAAANDKA